MPDNNEKRVYKKCRRDMLFHVEHIQGVSTLEGFQRGIIQEINDHDRVAIQSCHNLGKTFIAAKTVLWYASTFPRCKVITTAPTAKQVRLLLWSEINAGYARSKYPLGGEMLLQEWKLDKDWFAVGFTSKHEAGEEGHGANFQGFHAPHVLIIFDEATGIPASIWKQAEGMLTSGRVKFVALGNPTSRMTRFFHICNSDLWHVIKLSCFLSPNLQANNLNKISDIRKELARLKKLTKDKLQKRLVSYKCPKHHMLSARWVMELAYDVGIEHPLFQSKALGKYPETDEYILIPLAMVELAQSRTAKKDNKKEPSCFGVDVARYGSDQTVITEMRGSAVVRVIRMSGKSNTQVAGRVVQMINRTEKPAAVAVDATGLGSGVIDGLRESRSENAFHPDVQLYEVHFGEGAVDRSDKTEKEEKKKYGNRKAQMFCELRDDLKSDIVLTDEPFWQRQLPAMKYRLDSKGRIFMESKEDFKKRTGMSSPDEADSLALANEARKLYDEDDSVHDISIVSLTKRSTWGV